MPSLLDGVCLHYTVVSASRLIHPFGLAFVVVVRRRCSLVDVDVASFSGILICV